MMPRFLLVGLAALAGVPAAFGGDAKPQFMLLGESKRPAIQELEREAVVRSRAVSIDTAKLSKLGAGQAFTLNLFEDVWLDVVIDKTWTDRPGRTHWQGHVDGHANSSVLIVLNDGAVASIIRVPGIGVYRLRSTSGRGPVAEELDSASFPPCGDGHDQIVHPDHEGAAGPDGGLAGPVDCVTFIDIMILYTPEARDIEGGVPQIEAVALVATDEANLCYTNSAINPRVHLVHTGLVDYVESGSFGTDLSRLTSTNDGPMDEIHALRNQYGADLVDLLISNTQGGTICGLGWLMSPPDPGFDQYGFSVCNSGCANGGLTVCHELGHNMGCHHDRDNAPEQGAYDFSYGWRFTASDGELYRTVMSYSPGNRIPYFSNPLINYLDTPTGVPGGQPDSADNALTINLTAPIVSNFRGTSGSISLVWGSPTIAPASGVLANDRLGTSVAIDHNVAIIGAYTDDSVASDAGAAYVYRLNPTTGAWSQEAKLTAFDGSSGDRFGISVAIHQDQDSGVETAVVGAFLDDDGGRDSGSAYTFKRVGGTWISTGKLTALDPAGGDSFGFSVGITREAGTDLAIVGSYLDDDNGTNSGSAYIFRRSGGSWTQEEKIKPTTDAAQAGDQFGLSVAIGIEPGTGEEFALIGAWKDDEGAVDAGSAYIFKHGQDAWTQDAKLTNPGGQSGDQLGYSVGLSLEAGRVAVVGAWKSDTGSSANTGSASVFRDAGKGWTQEATLTASDPGIDDSFGNAVSISGNAIIVGAFQHDQAVDLTNTGGAYIFRYNGVSWGQEANLTAPDAAADDQFGFSVGISGTRAIIGSWRNDNADPDTGSFYTAAGVTFTDCNSNGLPDQCDITSGASLDENGNGIPDECEVPPNTCPADITADGTVNIDDLLSVIGGWGACSGCPADVAPPGGDGLVNIDDLLTVIGGWGPCP